MKLEGQPAVAALERLTGPRGAHVAYAGYNQPYLFFGSRFQNDLQIVPRNRSVDAQYYRWGMRMANPYVEGSYSRWKEILDDLGDRVGGDRAHALGGPRAPLGVEADERLRARLPGPGSRDLAR